MRSSLRASLPTDVPTIPALDPGSKASVELARIEQLITADRR
jgi:hypothetical protein